MKQLVLDLPYTTSYHPADFASSDCNHEALTAIREYLSWPSYGICVVGPAASGKTHLTAVYHSYVPTAHAINACDPLKAKNIFDISATHIIIDDADNFKDEKAFFHLINLIKQRKGRLLITATTPPSEWKIRLPDLKSRLCSLPIIYLKSPDQTLFKDILLKLLSDRQIIISAKVLEYIMKYIQIDIHILNDFVSWLDQEIYREKKPLSRTIFRNVLFTHTNIMNENAKRDFLGQAH